TEWTRR
ncbi:MAG: hypothetical protein EZS28_030018, partial [Streblomastix strix]